MSIINITDITVLDNKFAKFSDPYRFKITFECMAPLEDDLEWKLVYVGSAESESYDQELDTCMVGPIPVGINSFEFEAAAPSPAQIPASELLGVTVILLTCSYNNQEFIRIGYYVNNAYSNPTLKQQYDDSLVEGSTVQAPDVKKHFDDIVREVLVEKPRVTRFHIRWDATIPMNVDSTTDNNSEAFIPKPFDPSLST